MTRYTCSVTSQSNTEYELDLVGASFKLIDGAGATHSGRVHRERDKLILEAKDMRWEAKFNGECLEVVGVGTFYPR